MTDGAYYNEIDPFAAAWLRELIARRLIAPGDVDERSIADVQATDLLGYTQCHFFAGIGVWSHALRAAGWPDDRAVWTGSCPCQPFSAAGKGLGTDDARHLWPEFARLIGERRPAVVFGEQVASAAGRAWLDGVHADLEALDYACGAADLCAAGVGAPHIRQRLYWVADANGGESRETGRLQSGRQHGFVAPHSGASRLADTVLAGRAEGWPGAGDGPTARRGGADGVADADRAGSQGRGLLGAARGRDGAGECAARPSSASGGMGDADRPGRSARDSEPGRTEARPGEPTDSGALSRPDAPHRVGGAADWLLCTDGKWRPVEPGTFPLAHGAPARVGRLRGYGNAIHAQVAATFVEAFCEARSVIGAA